MLAFRRELLDQLGALRKLCAELDPQTAECSAATLDALRNGIAACEQRMLEGIAANAVLSRRANMPGLGTLGRRAASLLRPPPYDRDSRRHVGGRLIRGGSLTWRPSPRSAGSPTPRPAAGV